MKGKEDRGPETRGEQSLPTASSQERRRKERVWKVAAVTAYKGREVVKEYLHTTFIPSPRNKEYRVCSDGGLALWLYTLLCSIDIGVTN